MPYLFSAKELDPETGLYDFGARYLNPRFAQWMTTDPALGEYLSDSIAGGLSVPVNFSLYAYGRNSPLSRIDPDGRQSAPVPGVGTECGAEGGASQESSSAAASGEAGGDAASGASDSASCAAVREGMQVLGTKLTAAGVAAVAAGTALASSPQPVMKAAGMAVVMVGILLGGLGGIILGNQR